MKLQKITVTDCLIKAHNGTYFFEKGKRAHGSGVRFYREDKTPIDIQAESFILVKALCQALTQLEKKELSTTVSVDFSATFTLTPSRIEIVERTAFVSVDGMGKWTCKITPSGKVQKHSWRPDFS